jgi:hypothetical protein
MRLFAILAAQIPIHLASVHYGASSQVVTSDYGHSQRSNSGQTQFTKTDSANPPGYAAEFKRSSLPPPPPRRPDSAMQPPKDSSDGASPVTPGEHRSKLQAAIHNFLNANSQSAGSSKSKPVFDSSMKQAAPVATEYSYPTSARKRDRKSPKPASQHTYKWDANGHYFRDEAGNVVADLDQAGQTEITRLRTSQTYLNHVNANVGQQQLQHPPVVNSNQNPAATYTDQLGRRVKWCVPCGRWVLA